MDFEWEELINGESEIDAENLNLLAEAIIENENDIKQAQTTSESNRTSISRIDDEIENINETLDTQNEKNNEFIKKFSPVIVGRGIGENIYINDASDAPLLGLRVMGKTEQVKTEGINLLNHTANSQTVNGVTFTVNADKSITANGTATAEFSYFIKELQPVEQGETYFLSGCPKGASLATFYVYGGLRYNGTFVRGGVDVGEGKILEAALDTNQLECYIKIRLGVTLSNATFYPMLVKGSAKLPYEPYTGGKPSPSPEYPQELVDYSHNGGVSISLLGDNKSKSVELPLIKGLAGDGNVADEIDLITGVVTKRMKRVVVEELRSVGAIDIAADGRYLYTGTANFEGIDSDSGLCTIASYSEDAYGAGAAGIPSFSASGGQVSFFIAADSVEDFRSKVIGCELLLQSSDVEQFIDESVDVESFKNLTLFKPDTEFIPTGEPIDFRTEPAPMLKIEYIADTKTYIDNKFAELQTTILNNL